MTSTVGSRDRNDSEYSDASQDIRKNATGNEEDQQESDYDSAGSDLEHSENDPEASQEQEKKVDDDEDRSNPQYIPKRGTFYEHDDRTAGTTEETENTTSETASEKKEGSETPSERRRPPRKSEIIDKWSHDKFNENEQSPKSREELVAIYGYDIRNEEAPPHARRNRRYGRGPNKYTRTWEDEEAYKQKAAAVNRKPPNPDEFPELNATGKRVGKKPSRPMRPRSKSQPASNESSESNGPVNLRRNASIKTPRSARPAPKSMQKNVPNSPKPFSNSNRDNKMPAIENLTITTTVSNNSGPAQRKVNAAHWPAPGDQKRKPAPQSQNNIVQNNKPTQQQQPSVQQKTEQQTQQPQQQQPNQPVAESRGGSKRYSSLRQRPLAEPYSPQPQQVPLQQPQQNPQQTQQQPQHRFVADYQQQNNQPTTQHQGSPVQQLHPSQLIHQQMQRTTASQSQHGPSPPHQLTQPQHNQQQVRLGLLDQQALVSHTHHQLHNIPQPHASALGQLQPAQGYAPPAMMPAQFMQQPTNSPVYAAPPMYAQPPPNPYTTPHQLFQHHNYAAQAGGVTYYSPEVQPEQPPPRAQRRPTAAIPIVRPNAPDRQTNSSEKENIDRIVENMFVRKPWPAAPNSDNKEKSEARSSQEPQSKESSQPNSLTSSTISESKSSEVIEEKPAVEQPQVEKEKEESISTDA